jgi:hypothetical protein
MLRIWVNTCITIISQLFGISIPIGTKLRVYRLGNVPFQGVENIYEAVCKASHKALKDTINKQAEALLGQEN